MIAPVLKNGIDNPLMLSKTKTYDPKCLWLCAHHNAIKSMKWFIENTDIEINEDILNICLWKGQNEMVRLLLGCKRTQVGSLAICLASKYSIDILEELVKFSRVSEKPSSVFKFCHIKDFSELIERGFPVPKKSKRKELHQFGSQLSSCIGKCTLHKRNRIILQEVKKKLKLNDVVMIVINFLSLRGCIKRFKKNYSTLLIEHI